MRKKRLFKFLNKMFNNTFVQIVFYILGFLVFFAISGGFSEKNGFFSKIMELIRSPETLSIFFVGCLSLIVAKLLNKIDDALEETMKIEDNHHKIIYHYNGHPNNELPLSKNYFDKIGNYMNIRNVAAQKVKNHYSDPYSSNYQQMQKEIDEFENGKLVLPTINVYANILGNGSLRFDDRNKDGEIPSFIIKNSSNILNAHRHSKKANNVTIRLRDVDVDGETLVLHTERSNYIRMLLTNRCMDYALDNGMSIRDLYEYDRFVSPLDKSKLSNQIGINGMVLTSDGYLLVEKRDNSKTTWKNKFAQPISLALKENDVILNANREIDSTEDDAAKSLFAVIRKTLKSNFGFTPDDYEDLTFQNNFLGLARDLLEGGKPNLYFVVTMKHDAKQLLELLRKNAAETDPKKALKTEKLISDYYLIDFNDMKFGFQYQLKLRRDKIYKVDRLVYPRVSKRKARAKRFSYKFVKYFDKYLQHECGEALLVTFAYLELCKNRIPAIKNKGV